jgi:uncharacterized protein YlaI
MKADYCSYCAVEKEVDYKVYQIKGFPPKRTYVCADCQDKIQEVIRAETPKLKPEFPLHFAEWIKRNDILWRETIPGRKKTRMR